MEWRGWGRGWRKGRMDPEKQVAENILQKNVALGWMNITSKLIVMDSNN